ncbi:hypothetical protein ABZW30_13020 [Kitasatospora sp. NPDC004669]|uniref:hypothetical protein n=1 Tax=Kitasatospora sp. NPDC004669 TaxID=3154555 RepID=UPI00339F3904
MVHNQNGPEEMLELGRQQLSAGDRDAAEALFRSASRAGGPEVAWRVAELWAGDADARAAEWQRRAISGTPQTSGIDIDSGTLPIRTNSFDVGLCVAVDQRWEVAVRADDRHRAVAALIAAKPRLSRVTDAGREYSEEEYAAALDSVDFYSPNCVSVIDDGGTDPRVQLDCKGDVMPAMAREVLRILVEEMVTAGVAGLLFTPASDRD